MIFFVFLFATTVFLASCHKSSPVFIYDKSVEIEKESLTWKEGIGRKEIFRTENFSFHIVRIDTREKPHIHKNHDLLVFLIRGEGKFFIGGKEYFMKEKDSAFVPAGTIHYFVALKKPVYAIVVFSPPFDGKDTVEVDENK